MKNKKAAPKKAKIAALLAAATLGLSGCADTQTPTLDDQQPTTTSTVATTTKSAETDPNNLSRAELAALEEAAVWYPSLGFTPYLSYNVAANLWFSDFVFIYDVNHLLQEGGP